MENTAVYKYYKNYIKINDREFLWDDISNSRGKRLVIDNINGLYRPVIQYLGPNETTFSITIKYGGIYKSGENSSKEELKNSFLEQKNFLENIINTEKCKNVKIEFPDGDIFYGVLRSANKGYFSLGLNTESLEFVALQYSYKTEQKADVNKIKNLKSQILNELKTEIQNGELPNSFMQKINNTKNASLLSTTNENIKNIYKSFRKYSNLVKSYVTKVQNILNTVQDNINFFVSTLQEPLRILNMLKYINGQLVNIAKTPGKIVDTIEEICDGIYSYFNDTKNTIKFLYTMFDFSTSNNDKLVEYYNINKLQEAIMEKEIKDSSNIVYFTNIMELSTEVDFNTDEEIESLYKQINEMYNNLYYNDSISIKIKDLLFSCFNETKQYLLEEAVAKNNIKYLEIKTPQTLHKIVYDYYGNEDLFEDILLLNNNIIDDILNVSGKIKIFDI